MLDKSSITATHLMGYLYCPRFTYFEYVLDIPEHQEKRFKVEKGRHIHEKIKNQNPDYLRKKLGVKNKKSNVYLSSPLGIRGIIDEILFLKDGSAASLDYKYAEYKEKIFKTYRNQLIFYGQLIKDNYDIPVNKGFIIYTKSQNKLVEVEIKNKDYADLKKIIKKLIEIIYFCKYPKPTSVKRRCYDCCYRNVCEISI